MKGWPWTGHPAEGVCCRPIKVSINYRATGTHVDPGPQLGRPLPSHPRVRLLPGQQQDGRCGAVEQLHVGADPARRRQLGHQLLDRLILLQAECTPTGSSLFWLRFLPSARAAWGLVPDPQAGSLPC